MPKPHDKFWAEIAEGNSLSAGHVWQPKQAPLDDEHRQRELDYSWAYYTAVYEILSEMMYPPQTEEEANATPRQRWPGQDFHEHHRTKKGNIIEHFLVPTDFQAGKARRDFLAKVKSETEGKRSKRLSG